MMIGSTAADSFDFVDIKDGTSNTLGYSEQQDLYRSAVENDETHWVGHDGFWLPEIDDEVVVAVKVWGDPHLTDRDATWGAAAETDGFDLML